MTIQTPSGSATTQVTEPATPAETKASLMPAKAPRRVASQAAAKSAVKAVAARKPVAKPAAVDRTAPKADVASVKQPKAKLKLKPQAEVKAKVQRTPALQPDLAATKSSPAAKPDDKRVRQRQKLVRDSFTMPRADFDLIEVLKLRAIGFQRPTRKSELLRAGLQVLADLSPSQLAQVLDRLPRLKPGRPKKGD